MRTATITFHASHNYGSMLQAYALQHIVKALGHDNEIINLRTDRQKHLYRSYATLPLLRRLVLQVFFHSKYAGALKKYQLYEDFLKNDLCLTPEFKDMDAISRAGLDYDCYISGGDQIWNTVPTDFDWSFYLPFTNGKKISYGVSMGPRGEEQVTQRDKVGQYLSDYTHIGVRENGTKAIVETLTGKNATITLDPVLLLPKEQWMAKYPQQPIIPGNYIFVYSPRYKKNVYDIAVRLGRKYGYKVISSINIHPKISLKGGMCGVTEYLTTGPWEFLNLLQHAKFIVSGSFHAVVFSILFNRPFFAVNGDNDNRMRTTLENCGLMQRTISEKDFDEKAKIAEQCDFTTANTYLEAERARSIAFLKNSIEN